VRQYELEELRGANDFAHCVVHWLCCAPGTDASSIASASIAARAAEEALHEDSLNCFCMRRHRTCEEGPNLSTQPRTNACFVLVTQVCAFGQVLEELAVRYTFVRVVDHKDHGLRWRTV
jgi:hypothetical protein